jgi:hypothetical protein
MKAVWQLLVLPMRRMLVGCVLIVLMYFGSMAAMVALHEPNMIVGVGAMGWMGHAMIGGMLRPLLRPEMQMLPGFRRQLALAGLIDLALFIGLPVLAMILLGGTAHALLAAALILLAMALGMASGTGQRAAMLFWLVFVAAGWKPALAAMLAKAALASPFTPLLTTLAAVLLLIVTLRPLLRISDPEPESSPLESTGLGRMSNATPEGVPRSPGALGKRIGSMFDGIAQQAMDRALVAYRQHPGAMRRMILVRRLLLPHDNPPAILLRLALVALMVTFYVFAMLHRQHFDAAVIGAYAILLALSRFPQLGRGMLRMRPNLADLYLTLAPSTRADYQKTLADALLVLVPISMLTALAYTLLGIALTHAAEPSRMLLTAAIIACAASLVALAVHLIGPEGSLGRGVVNLVVLFGAMGAYWGGYALIGWLGLLPGGALLAVLTISFGGGVWFAAQREYQRRAPVFDIPLG